MIWSGKRYIWHKPFGLLFIEPTCKNYKCRKIHPKSMELQKPKTRNFFLVKSRAMLCSCTPSRLEINYSRTRWETETEMASWSLDPSACITRTYF